MGMWKFQPRCFPEEGRIFMEEILKQRALSFMIPADHSLQSAGPVETPRHSSSAAASAPSEFREFSPLSEGETSNPLSLQHSTLSAEFRTRHKRARL